MLQVKSFVFSPLQENTYLVYDDLGSCAIIDPGCYSSLEQQQLDSFIRSNKLEPKLLLNTHCHIDHVFGNAFVHRAYGLPLHLHPQEEQVLSYAPLLAEQWGLSYVPYDGPLQLLTPGSVIVLGAENLDVLFTPGHSPGSVSFYHADGKWVVSGDVLFQGSIGRTDLPGGHYETLLKSIREELFTLPDEVRVYSGHGPVTFIGTEKASNPFFIDQR